MGQFFNSINEVRKNYSKYDNWEQAQADERAKKEYLATTLDIPKDKLELTKSRAETVIRASEIMDARSEDNCQNMEMFTGLISAFPPLALVLSQPYLIRYADSKINAKANKSIAKLKEELLNTSLSEDILKAKAKELQKLSQKVTQNSKKILEYGQYGMLAVLFATTIGTILWGNSKQKEASRIGRFQAKQDELQDIKNFVIYTPEQIEQAQEIANTIPDEKERNSILKMLRELKDIARDQKAYRKWLAEKDETEIEKLKSVDLSPNSEKYIKAKENQELIVDAVKEINIKAEEYSENVENSYDTLGTLSWLIAIPAGMGINKLLKMAKANTRIRTVIAAAVPILTSLGIQMAGTFEEKNAARVGRFKARQDLLKNPARLMAYSDEEMKMAKDVKAEPQKRSFLKKLGGSFAFLIDYIKDKSEYNEYKEKSQKQNEKLNKALQQVEVSEEQITKAKSLQKNVFRAFDEIDEMSQRYSEDTEAATEIAKQVGTNLWTLGSIVGASLFTLSVVKGKFPLVKVANWLTNLTFDAKSPIKIAINNINKLVKQSDKKSVEKFQKAIVCGDIQNFLDKSQNKPFLDAVKPLLEEFGKIGLNGMSQLANANGSKDASAILSELFNSHFKQTALAKWARNMVTQSTKLWMKSKASSAGMEIPKEMQEKLGLNFNYKNYKTLINTGAVASAPVLGTIFAVPYAFNAWLTNIQKKAGKIGIMKAMERVDDPKVFVEEE